MPRKGHKGRAYVAERLDSINVRVERDLGLRVRARAISEGITRAEVIRRAIERYLQLEKAPTHARQKRGRRVNLIEVLQLRYQIPSSVARSYIAQGRVTVDGKVVHEFWSRAPRTKRGVEIVDREDERGSENENPSSGGKGPR
jgi:hypothetical protein